jgi:hypothetical protein
VRTALALWGPGRGILPCLHPQVINEPPKLTFQRIPVVLEPFEYFFKLLTHFASEGRVVIRETDGLVCHVQVGVFVCEMRERLLNEVFA